MLVAPITPDRDLTPIEQLVDGLNALAHGLEERFRGVGETLADAIDTIDRMAGALDEVQRALAPERAGAAVTELRAAAARLTALPETQHRRAEAVAQLTQRTRTLRALLAEMGEVMRLLGCYGMSIKIASAGEPAFFQFVAVMQAKLDGSEQQLRRFAQELERFMRIVAELQATDARLAGECAKVGVQAPVELAASADALEAQLASVARTAHEVSGITRTVQGEVARVLGAIQIGDSVRQRVEHCVAVLRVIDPSAELTGERPAPPPRGAVAHVARLVAAQMRAIADDFRDESIALLDSLARLGPLAADLLTLVEAQAASVGETAALAGGGGGALGRLEQGIAALGDITARLFDTDEQLGMLAAFVEETVVDLGRDLQAIRAVTLDVQDIATNTRLLCRRHGETGRAVAVIATEIDPCARKLERLRGAVAEQVAALDGVALGGDGPATGGDTRATLRDALAVVRAASDRSDAAVAGSGDAARRVVAALEHSMEELHEQQMFISALESASGSLRDCTEGHEALSDADTASLRTLLPWVAGLYTMAREREIHALFLLPGMTMRRGEDALPQADDDGLF
ncbi:hypothetical protein K7957_09035 [Sphingomonas yunnanensis]|uniref:hypothetical protein n=1 Tax=Sphingomonas yunnanensis TaxID=310400 RepID=UPI001CA6B9E4|nr:hypothetical protein [Sphingomonas yunnanensis]MBY9063076.1 hypothetical protein [Sphingomonas yunnanensis]